MYGHPQSGGVYFQVCASDGRTYSNECKMRKAACEAGVTLFVKYNGICGTLAVNSSRIVSNLYFAEGCAKKNCQYYSSCVVENGKAECRCPTECYRKLASVGTASTTDDSIPEERSFPGSANSCLRNRRGDILVRVPS